MTSVDARTLHVTQGTVSFGDYATWYRITSTTTEPLGGGRPLVVAHGGPGCTHDYLLSLTDLVRDDRPVIHYDQLGNGRSTHLPDAPASLWTVETFLAELETLLAGLGIADDYDFLGQSWGGMLGAEHAALRPAGLRHLVIANSPASMPLWLSAAAKLRARLPADVAAALTRNEAVGSFDTDEYRAATAEYYARHVSRIVPAPPEVLRTRSWVAQDPTVYHTMNGPTEFHVIGSLRDWSVIDRLPAIEARTLIVNGRHDEATDDTVAPFVDQIPGAAWHRFEGSSHMPHLEERAEYMRVVSEFLDGPGDPSSAVVI